MSKVKYRFNSKSLTYEKVKTSFKVGFLYVLSYLATGIVFATITIILSRQFLPSPSEKKQNRELEVLKLQYELLDTKMNLAEKVLYDLEDRDDNIYRAIFESEPLPKTIRYGGSGGSDKYSVFDVFENADLLKSSTEKLDKISKQIYIQSKSFDEVVNLAKNKKDIDFHRDQWDSIFWQCIGTTRWTIVEKGIDAPVQEFILNTGDVAVIPSGVFHGIKIEGPRASIAYGYRVITKEIDNKNRDFNRASI